MFGKLSKKIFSPVIVLSLVLFIIGLWMLHCRWINPDEGAHLADAKLLLAGKIPDVDYASRQPFYVFLLALFLKIWGISYESGRLLVLLAAVAVSVLIFLISKELFNRRVAITSQVVYVFLPFTILFSVITKMNFIATFLESLGIFFYLASLKTRNTNFPIAVQPKCVNPQFSHKLCFILQENQKIIYLFLSGLTIGSAYYVRESSLAVSATILVTIILLNGKQISLAFKQLIIFLSGFFFIVCLILFFYLNYMTFHEFWHSSLNPFDLPLQGISKIISFFSMNNTENDWRIPGQSVSRAAREASKMVRMNVYLIVGFVFYIGYFVKDLLKEKRQDASKYLAQFILFTWLTLDFIVYCYYYYARGFYAEYTIELFPPLVIGLSYVVIEKLVSNKSHFSWYLVIYVLCAYGVFFIQKFVKLNLEMSSYFLILFLVTVICTVMKKIVFGKKPVSVSIWLSEKSDLFRKFVLIPMLLSSLIFSFSIASRYLQISYNSVWSPETVTEVEKYLIKDSQSGDTLLSGGMIWTINSKIQPFLDITHPIAFLSEFDNPLKRDIEIELQYTLPTYIVLDGFTNECYSFIHSLLKDIIQNHYAKQQKIGAGRHVIVIYKLKKDISPNK